MIVDNFDPTIIETWPIRTFGFPKYIDPNVKDDMAVDALGEVPILPIKVEVKTDLKVYELKVWLFPNGIQFVT